MSPSRPWTCLADRIAATTLRFRHGLLVAALASGACAEAPVRAPVQRLLPDGAARHLEPLGKTWRRAARLRPGESHASQAEVVHGSSLLLSLAGDPWPRRGALRLEVSVNRRAVFEAIERPKVLRWWNVRVPLDVEGSAQFEIRVDHVRLDGSPLPPGDLSPEPWVLLGTPRVVPPRAADNHRLLVWISQETLRADHLGSYGYGRATSPAFDRATRDWALFDQAVATASWTLPSMASQFTARYPSWHGAVHWKANPAQNLTSLFDVLAGEGFFVAGVATNRFLHPEGRIASGLDAVWQADLRSAEQVNDMVRDALDEWHGGDLALFVHYFDPHHDYQPPPPYDRRFGSGYEGPVTGFNFRDLPIASLDAPALEHLGALYDGEIAFADAQIGELLAHVDGLPGSARAVLVYSADHGEAFMEHGQITHGGNLYEELIRVPLALRIPGIPTRRVMQPVSMIDLAPTILDAFGMPSPASFQGRSLLPVLRAGSEPRGMVFAELAEEDDCGQWIAVRDGQWKYHALFEKGPAEAMTTELLFDLLRDPKEQHPVAGSPQRERLRAAVLAYRRRAAAQTAPGSEIELDPETIADLKALGYLR